MYKDIIKQINPEEWYRISTIVKNKWIMNTVGGSSKYYIHGLIKQGKLLSRDFGSGRRHALYMIKGEEIINYIRKAYL
jgi:hypothetical protein